MATTQQQATSIKHVDLPDLRETFADSIHTLVWDGQTFRIEFCVTRFPEPKPNAQMEATRYPACRLVLSASAAADLSNRLQQTMAALRNASAQPKPPQGQPAAADAAAEQTAPHGAAADNNGGTPARGRPER